MRGRRFLAASAAAIAVCIAIAGCSLLPSVVGLAAPAKSAAPAVGQCWNASKAQADSWADWKGSGHVSCSGAHVLYTYAVGTVSGVASGSWAESGGAGTLSTKVEAKAEAACNVDVLLPGLLWNQELVTTFFFVPTEAEWSAGARWVRCDVGVLAFGTTISDETFARLPAKISTLVSAVTSDPKRYEFCIESPVPVSEAGPLDNENARIADCRTTPQWTLAGHGLLPEAVGSPYPSGEAANADSATICSKYAVNDNEVWIAYLPVAANDGTVSSDRVVDCWVGQKSDDGSGSAGTV